MPESSKISVILHHSKFAIASHPVLAVDGVSLDLWLNTHIPESKSLGLVPAQAWLIDDSELEMAWHWIIPAENDCSTMVPLLICPDDVDLSYTVIVVKQLSASDSIVWKRFGYALDNLDKVIPSVFWFSIQVPIQFEREDYVMGLTHCTKWTYCETNLFRSFQPFTNPSSGVEIG